MSAVAQGHRPVGTPSLGAWRGLFKQQWLFCLQAVTVFGSTNSYRISLAPASNLHGMNRILHLVSRLLSLPPVREVAWGPHVAARGVPFKAIRCGPSRDRPDCRAGFGAPSCSLKFTFLAVSQTRRRIPTQGLGTGSPSACGALPRRLHGSHLCPAVRSLSGVLSSVSALPLLFLHSVPTLPVLFLFFCMALLVSLLEGQFCGGWTLVCVPCHPPEPGQVPDSEYPREQEQVPPGGAHYISQALTPRVPGWRGCPRWVPGEACLNSSGSSTCCKLLLYLIPPTIISSLSLLPSPGTCLLRGHRRRQLGVNLGSVSVPNKCFLRALSRPVLARRQER